MKGKKEQILYSSDKAAQYRTGLEGWVDRMGRFWGNDEHMARWCGCTHIACKECAKPIPVRSFTICDDCTESFRQEKYNNMQQIEWDEETPLYSDSHDEYFFDSDQLYDYIEENECTIKSLNLIVCIPNYLSQIDEGFFYDELPEDCEINEDVKSALEYLNEVIRKQPPASWSPGKYAAKIKE